MFRVVLKELREKTGYKSQQSFANAFGVAQSTVGGWESGAREPNFATLLRLSEFFGVTVGYLLGKEKDTDAAYIDSSVNNLVLSENLFGIILKKLREEHGYRSQQAFAKEFGVAQTTVASWEGGTREPNLDTIYRLADFFGVTVGYLLGKEKPADISADGLSSDDMELWELFQAATPEKKAAIRALLK